MNCAMWLFTLPGKALVYVWKELVMFGLEKYSSVSSIVSRTEQQLSKNQKLRNLVDKVKRELTKGQAKTCPPLLE